MFSYPTCAVLLVLYLLLWFTCLVSYILSYRAVRVLVLHVPPVFLRLPCLVSHILLCVMCLTWHMLNVLSCFICLLPSVLSCSLCLTYFTCLMSNILSSSSSPLVICLLSFRIFSYLIIFPAWQCTKNEVFFNFCAVWTADNDHVNQILLNVITMLFYAWMYLNLTTSIDQPAFFRKEIWPSC